MNTDQPSRESVIEDLEKSRSALWRVDAMAAVLSNWDPDEHVHLGEFVIYNYVETMRDLLGPTYEAIDNAIKRIEAD